MFSSLAIPSPRDEVKVFVNAALGEQGPKTGSLRENDDLQVRGPRTTGPEMVWLRFGHLLPRVRTLRQKSTA